MACTVTTVSQSVSQYLPVEMIPFPMSFFICFRASTSSLGGYLCRVIVYLPRFFMHYDRMDEKAMAIFRVNLLNMLLI